MKVVKHIEFFIGEIDKGWQPTHSYMGVQCVRFTDQPFKNINTYSTLGLNKYKLNLNNKEIRHELIFSIDRECKGEEVASMLISLAEDMIKLGKGLLRGQVLGPNNVLFTDAKFTGLYASIPVFFEENFQICYDDLNPPIVFVWLIPLYSEEIVFVRENGWNAFEDILEKQDDSLFWDKSRYSFIPTSNLPTSLI